MASWAAEASSAVNFLLEARLPGLCSFVTSSRELCLAFVHAGVFFYWESCCLACTKAELIAVVWYVGAIICPAIFRDSYFYIWDVTFSSYQHHNAGKTSPDFSCWLPTPSCRRSGAACSQMQYSKAENPGCLLGDVVHSCSSCHCFLHCIFERHPVLPYDEQKNTVLSSGRLMWIGSPELWLCYLWNWVN